MQNRTDQLGKRRHAEIVVDAQFDVRDAVALVERPRSLEFVEVAFGESVVDARLLIVENVFFGPLDRRFFDERLPSRDRDVAVAAQHLDVFDVRHEVGIPLHILGEFVDLMPGGGDFDRRFDVRHARR